MKWEDSTEIILIIAQKSRTCTLSIAALTEKIIKMHFAQTRNCRERKKEREGQPCKCQHRYLPAREPIPTQVSARWSELWHTSSTLGPCQAAPSAAPAAPPEAHTLPDSHNLYLSWPDYDRSGTHTWAFPPACCHGLGSTAIALLSLCRSLQGEEPRAAVPSQVRVGNQPPLTFQKLSLWSWARETHLDARCDVGQGF